MTMPSRENSNVSGSGIGLESSTGRSVPSNASSCGAGGDVGAGTGATPTFGAWLRRPLDQVRRADVARPDAIGASGRLPRVTRSQRSVRTAAPCCSRARCLPVPAAEPSGRERRQRPWLCGRLSTLASLFHSVLRQPPQRHNGRLRNPSCWSGTLLRRRRRRCGPRASPRRRQLPAPLRDAGDVGHPPPAVEALVDNGRVDVYAAVVGKNMPVVVVVIRIGSELRGGASRIPQVTHDAPGFRNCQSRGAIVSLTFLSPGAPAPSQAANATPIASEMASSRAPD